ncbi:MAG: starch-binding protein, partial [Prevotella sp.]|nr:starch-binding protein [Prevotella sp.]
DLTGGFPGSDTDQTKDVKMTKQSNGLYTYEVASFAAEAQKYEYKLRANKIWGLYELPSSGNAAYTFAEAGNYKLTFTANVTGEEIDGVAAYTLKLDVERILNTYTATFDNAANWEHVYAYTWTDGDPKVEQLGAWPGTEITKSGDVYTVSIEAAEAPAKIVFNDGSAESVVGVNQTADFTFVDGQAYVFTTLPGVPIWTSTEATKVDWEQGRFVALDASTFADAKVGDILHISIENPTINTEDEWVGQVALQDREKWTNLEGGKPIGSGTVSDAAFVITGDILARMQSVGLVVTGINYETSLITLEKDVFTGSAKTIWVGNATGNIAIDKAHFANSNNFTGVKVGDVIRVTFAGMDTGQDANNWCGINYNNASYKWSNFESGDFLDRNDYTKPVVDFVINSESAVAILNETNTGVFINNPTRTALQVELISFTGYYLATNESDWKTFTTMTEEAGKYTATVSGAGTYFAIVPNTAMTIDEDAIATWKSVIRPNSTNDFVVDFANYSDVTKVDGDKVWQIGATNDADVTINYTPADGKFAISCQTEVEIGELGYSTYSNSQKYAVSGDGITASFVSVSGDVATLTEVAAGAVLPNMAVTNAAGKNGGVILKGTAGAKATISSVALDAEVTAAGVADNLMAGSGDYEYQLGTQFADGDEYIAYILYKNDAGEAAFMKWDGSDEPLAAHKAFLAVPKTNAAPQFIIFGGGEGTTGIEAVTPSQRTGQYYTLDGRRVENPTKGLYIINGKKVVIK